MKNKSILLNILRGTAALLVCVSHIRNYFFVDYYEIININYFDKIFYALTSMGHTSVIIFFVISGYLVGGDVIDRYKNNLFNKRKYAIDRLVRLWVVLIPALLLTLALDCVGINLTNGEGYDGTWSHLVQSGPSINITNDSLNFTTFIGNIFFLQTIIVPTYGSNTPLWSLSNEFWYYLLFPIIVSIFFGKKILLKLFIISIILFYLPFEIVFAFLYWIIGAFTPITGFYIFKKNKPFIKTSIIIFILSILIQMYSKNYFGNLILSLGTGILIFSLVNIKINCYILKKYADISSDISFSMYLCHFPIITFIWIILIAPKQFQPDLIGYGLFISVLFFTIFFVFIFWFLFERNNKILKNYIYSYFKIKK